VRGEAGFGEAVFDQRVPPASAVARVLFGTTVAGSWAVGSIQ
jgi:hypothetical protein